MICIYNVYEWDLWYYKLPGLWTLAAWKTQNDEKDYLKYWILLLKIKGFKRNFVKLKNILNN